MYKNKVYRNALFETVVQTYWHDKVGVPFKDCKVYMRALKVHRPGVSLALWWRDSEQAAKYSKPRIAVEFECDRAELFGGAIRCYHCGRLWPRERAGWPYGYPQWEKWLAIPEEKRPRLIGQWMSTYGYSEARGTYVTSPGRWRGPCCESWYPDEYIEDDLFEAMTDERYNHAHEYQGQ